MVKGNLQTWYQTTRRTCTTVLTGLENFNILENFETRTGQQRPPVTEKIVEAVSSYFC